MNRRDAATAAAAVEVLQKSGSGEARRCASAALASLGIDPYTALAEARAAVRPSGPPGPLRKDSGAAGSITVRTEMDGGAVLGLELSPREVNALVCSVYDALGGRSM